MAALKTLLLQEIEKIPHLEGRPSKVAGGHAIFYKNKEIAHFHSNNEIDIRLTKKLIKKEGLIHPTDSLFHSGRKPGSDWFEFRFKRKEHVEEALRLFKLALKEY